MSSERGCARAAGVRGSASEKAPVVLVLSEDGPPRTRTRHDHGGLAGHDPFHLRRDALTVRDELQGARETRSGEGSENVSIGVATAISAVFGTTLSTARKRAGVPS